MKNLLLAISMIGILFLLYLAQIRKPQTDAENYEGKRVEISGIVNKQRNFDEYSLLKIGNVNVLSEMKGNFTSRNVSVIGRVHEDIVIADEIGVED